MEIDMSVRMRESPDGSPLPPWLNESDEVYITTGRLIRAAWEDGYIQHLDDWGLSILHYQKIALGPLNEHRGAIASLPLIQIIDYAMEKYPERNFARVWVRIERAMINGKEDYVFLILDPQAKRRRQYKCFNA